MPALRKISRLRQRVTLQTRTTELDSLGRQIRGAGKWTATAKLWAEVLQVSGREAERARQIVADASHVVTIRYRASVSSDQRLLFGDRVLEIKAVLDPDNSQRQLQLICGELV